MIKTGRYGTVKYDPTGAGGATLVVIASLNTWKLSAKTDYEDVTCFGDANKKYVPGMKDMSGSLGGFWDSDDPTVFEATDAPTPGMLDLAPNSTEPTFIWSGLAYLDADIDASAKGAPKLTSTWKAADTWTMGWAAAGTTRQRPGGRAPAA
jgi:hypothetical protein